MDVNPKNPVGIISKGRHDSMLTSRSLSRMKVPHYIVVEPQDYNAYDEALDIFKIRPYVTLIKAPFSNHGDGPGRARNYFWDYAISLGAEKNWILDDNVADFYRLHNNKRIRAESGAIFKAAEDFVDRYENVPLSGFQYRFFIAPDSYYPPFTINTRIFSTLLIKNDLKYRWRGKYSEDIDLTLNVLKSGDCTVQFNAFLQGKMATQTLSGGNTAEFYHAEGEVDKSKWKGGTYNATGTINKSQMIVDMHPDLCHMVWRYDRWHHHCDLSGFKQKLILKPGIDLSSLPKVNNYGMRLETNFQGESNGDSED